MPANVWSLLGMQAVAVVILAAAYWATRWIGSWSAGVPGALPRGTASAKLRVLALLTLGRGERVVLVSLGGTCFLLGVAAGRVSLLREFDAEETQALLAGDGEADMAPPSFMDALKENLRKRK